MTSSDHHLYSALLFVIVPKEDECIPLCFLLHFISLAQYHSRNLWGPVCLNVVKNSSL